MKCGFLCACARAHACVCVWLGAHFDQSLLDEAFAVVALIKPEQSAPR